MGKQMVRNGAIGLLILLIGGTVAGAVVKKRQEGRIAPGVTVCGRELSGLTREEVTAVFEELVPETVVEIRCCFLPEQRNEVERRVAEWSRETKGETSTGGKTGKKARTRAGINAECTVRGNELYLTATEPLFYVSAEETWREITKRSNEVGIWEWLYEAITGEPLRFREAEAVFGWKKALLEEYSEEVRGLTEREPKTATVGWEAGQVKVTGGLRGFRMDREGLYEQAGQGVTEALERIKNGPVEGIVLRFSVTGTVRLPELTTAQAEKCKERIGAFITTYAGAGDGRAKNLRTGAARLHTQVILPGEEFSVAAALMPFTEENGYAAGGTYIDGQLSESIGGGVCQLSTTLYNALLRTKLEITGRYPHSMPVGYVSLGLDAAIAGDYKDLKFKNTTDTPVLLLCEATEEEIKVALYGPEEAKREEVTFESVVTEEQEERITVEVYRTETGTDGEVKRERVSRDTYRVKK